MPRGLDMIESSDLLIVCLKERQAITISNCIRKEMVPQKILLRHLLFDLILITLTLIYHANGPSYSFRLMTSLGGRGCL